MTITAPAPPQPDVDEAQLLFKEARQRRRKRRLAAAGVIVVATAAVGVTLVTSGAKNPARSPAGHRPTSPTRTVAGATVVPKFAWVDNYGQLHVGELSGPTQQVVARANADPTAPLVSAGGRVFWVRSQVQSPDQPVTPIPNPEVMGFDTATGRTETIAPGTQVMASADKTFIYVETDDRHLAEYSLDGTSRHRTLALPSSWFLLGPSLDTDPTPVIATGILVVSTAHPHTTRPDDGTLAVWNPASGHVQALGKAWQVSATYTAPGARSSLIAWYPASCTTSRTCPLQITNTATYTSRLIYSSIGPFLWGGGFSPDGSHLAVFANSADIGGDPTAQLAIVNTSSGQLDLVPGVYVYVGDSVHWAQWLPDGNHVLTGGLGGPFGSTAPAVDVLVNSETRQVIPFRFIEDRNRDLTISTVLVQ